MSIIPPHIAARRAAQRRTQRRRRLLAAGAAVVCAAAVAAVAALAGGSGAILPRHGRRSTAAVTNLAGGSRREGPRLRADAVDPAFRAYARLLHSDLPIYCGGDRGHELALTFDDGPGVYTHYALRKLRQYHEQATFFDTGRSINAWPGWIQRETRVAAIEDHTYTHPALIALSAAQIRYQLAATKELIQAKTHQRVELFRPPYELYNRVVEAIAHRLGLLTVLWDVDSQDSLGASFLRIAANVDAGLRPGAIIELHENRGQTIRALTTILPQLARRHLRSVSVPQLLASDPPSESQLRRGGLGCAGAVHAARPGRGG